MRIYLIAVRLKNDWLILITEHAPEQALSDYAKRWEIEIHKGFMYM